MKRNVLRGIILMGCMLAAVQDLSAQGYGTPLTIQQLNHRTISSVESRSMGGISVGIFNDPSLMFVNPAALSTMDGIRFSVGAVDQRQDLRQTQEWMPLRSFPTFSLMMEGLLGGIPDPDLSNPPPEGLGPEDSIPRPYDQIKPDWERSQERGLPLQATVAVPVEWQGLRIVGGLGAVQYANLDYYFENRNVLSPSIGTQRPYGVPLPGIGQEVSVRWSQSSELRKGSINGYGGAVAVGISDELTVGISGLVLRGTSDDLELSAARARIRFGNNNNVYYFKLDSLYSKTSKTGTSSFKGVEYTVSSLFRSRYITLSLSATLPTNIYRKFEGQMETDTTGVPSSVSVTMRDQIRIPWRTTLGISLNVRENLTVGLEYQARPFATAEYKTVGVVTNPWVSGSGFGVGGRYTPIPWLTIAAGMRQESEVFQEAGAPLIGEPVRYNVYSVGVQALVSDFRINLAYEYAPVKYQDLWQTNVNLNAVRNHRVLASLSYTLQ